MFSTRLRSTLAISVVAFAVMPAGMASADRAYTQRFGQVDRGDVTFAANTVMSCPSSAADCADARAGTGPSIRNSLFVMSYVDVDSDPSTFDSSRADLALPAGATVLFAGLYWGGDIAAYPDGVDAPTPAAKAAVKFAAGAGAAYTTINASQVDTSRIYGSRYQGFADVTPKVRAVGSGTYTVANLQTSTGRDAFGGWALVVTYRDASEAVHWIGVYDGFRQFWGGDPYDAVLGGFRTPSSGTVRADFGMVTYEGDLGVTGDVARLNGVNLTDPLHAAGNYWNSKITNRGQLVNAKSPNYVNQLGHEANVMNVDSYIPNNATSATVHMEIGSDLLQTGPMMLVTDQSATAPSASSLPTVSGSAADGATLTAGNGFWSGTTPMTFAYQWRRCDSSGAGCRDIVGATGASYVVAPGDVGSTLRVQVTATNVVGTADATSPASSAVAARTPANTAAPTVSGTARDGSTLSGSSGTWTGTPTIGFSYQWLHCAPNGSGCSEISGATGPTYALGPGDVGFTVRVEVTGTNGGGSSSATSAQTATVTARPPANTALPTITGTARDGSTLTATSGSWTGTPTVAFAYLWQRCAPTCNDIPGATSATYTLTPADVGATVKVEVTGSNGGGSATAASSPTGTVTARPPANTAAPAITGTARDGSTLTATSGSWTGTPTVAFAYQWQRCAPTCTDIASATSSTYTLTPSDVGATVRVEVTGSNGGGTATATSSPTGTVTARPPANTAAPTITGTTRDGSTLTASSGSWTGTPTIAFAYQWQRCAPTCTDIANATNATYTLSPSDVGATIKVEVTGSNGGGTATATGSPTGTVTARPPANTAAPTINGTVRDGSTLTASTGTWTGTPTIAFAYQWRRCGSDCTDIPGAVSSTYVLTPDDVDSAIRVVVTGSNAGGSSAATSQPTGKVAAVDPPPPPPPVDPPPDPDPGPPPPDPGNPPDPDPTPSPDPGPTPPPDPSPTPSPDPVPTAPRPTPTDPTPTDPDPADPPTPTSPAGTLRALQWRNTSGTHLRLRIDSTEAIARTVFDIPTRLLPKRTKSRAAVGRLEAGGRTWTLRFKGSSNSVLLDAPRTPRVRLVSGGIRVAGLPADVGTLRLTLDTPTARTADLRASVRTTGGGLEQLSFRLTTPSR